MCRRVKAFSLSHGPPAALPRPVSRGSAAVRWVAAADVGLVRRLARAVDLPAVRFLHRAQQALVAMRRQRLGQTEDELSILRLPRPTPHEG